MMFFFFTDDDADTAVPTDAETNSKQEHNNYSNSTFESIKHINDYGQEFWYARELQTALGYKHDLIQSLDFLNKLERFKDVPHRAKIEDKFIESSDLALLISEMKVDAWIDLTKFLALSGLRFGEAAALLFDDVDMKNRVIHVTKNYDYINHVTTSPKTLTSLRDVYIQDELAVLCRKLKAASFATFAMQDMNAQKLLFCDSNGEHIKYYAYNKYFRENTLRVLGKAYTVHSLRHTHASLLLEQGVDVDSISRRLGHSDSTVTREIYLHITKKKQNQENLKIKELKLIAQ